MDRGYRLLSSRFKFNRIDPEAMDPIIENLLVRWEDTRQSEHPETVESLCRDHPELRPLVEQRIEALRRIYRALSSAPSASDTGVRHGAEALPTIDGYECVAQIGQGGMGVVFRARQIRLGRSVAIKMLRGSFHDRRTLARFRSEAESVAKLKHPNIVQIYDVGEYRGQPFLVLEYTDGGNLHELIRGQPQPQAAAAQLVRDIARALACASTGNRAPRYETSQCADDAPYRIVGWPSRYCETPRTNGFYSQDHRLWHRQELGARCGDDRD